MKGNATRWSYVANLGPNDALDWGGDTTGNIPITGQYMTDFQDTKLYMTISWHAQQGNYEGRAVDWGAEAIKVDGPQILEILEECYGDLEQHNPKSEVGKLASFARKLPAGKQMALSACSM